MKDTYDRTIDYLRISVTDRCNLRCRYCMPEDLPFIPHDRILRYEEMIRIVEACVSEGITKIKVTGGEPLVRKGCTSFVRALKEIPGITSVTMTTNGVLLEENLPELKAAGVDALNVSLDSLKPERYAQITGKDVFPQVYRGIRGALDAGLRVKINCVPIHGVNSNEIRDFFALAQKQLIDVRFIEMMPIGNGKSFEPMQMSDILEDLKAVYSDVKKVRKTLGNGPAVYYRGDGFSGNVGFIGAVHHKFCDSCNRIRLTSEGFLKLCLHHSSGTDLRSLIRGGADDAALQQAIAEAISRKPKEHSFNEWVEDEDTRNMSQIGG